MNNTSKYFGAVVCFMIGSMLVGVAFYKAYSCSFTHDESFTYLNYPHTSFLDIISYKDWYTNNHILNSLAIKYSELLFGSTELALRLPNLTSLVIYLFILYKLCKHLKNEFLISIFCLLSMSPVLLDLFIMARGYGISIAFNFIAIYSMIQFIRQSKRTYLWSFHIASLLAILANFTALTLYATLLIVYMIYVAINTDPSKKIIFEVARRNRHHLAPLILNFIVLYEPIRRLISYGKLDFGGKGSFQNETLHSISASFIPEGLTNPTSILILKSMIVFTALGSAFYFLLCDRFTRLERIKKNLLEFSFTSILFVLSSIIIINHFVLNADYPIGRFAMFILPIVCLQLALFLYRILENSFQRGIPFLALTFVSFCFYGFFADLRWKVIGEWAYDQDTKEAFKIIVNDIEHSPTDGKVKIGADWHFEPTLNFYRETSKHGSIESIERDGFKSTDHYFFLFKSELEEVQKYEPITLMEFKASGTVLLKNSID